MTARPTTSVEDQHMTGPGNPLAPARSGVMSSNRLEAFSDGVFAIAITLLVLAIRVPDISKGKQAEQLPGALIGLWPSIATYALSFIVVGAYWIAHQRIFHYITRSDSGLL